jgi:3-mercaptopyruvate sulfurtransferase SseA
MARAASNILYGMGWRNHRVLREGLPGWVEKGYAVEGQAPHREPEH